MVYSKLTVLDSTSQTSKSSLNKRVYIEYSERLLSSESGRSVKPFKQSATDPKRTFELHVMNGNYPV